MDEKNFEKEGVFYGEKRHGVDEITRMIEERRFADFRDATEAMQAADIAEILDGMPKEYALRTYRLLPKETAAEVFVEMDREMREHLINLFSDTELSLTLEELYIDDTVDIIEEMPATVVKRIIKSSAKENRAIINNLLKYGKNSAGSIMTTEYVRFKRDMTVDEALSHIRRVAGDKETVYTCYVTDGNRRLIGIVTARDLLTSELTARLEDIMTEGAVFVYTDDTTESVGNKFEKYGFLALPVVDKECRLVGIITVDDVIGVIKEKTEEDFAKMAAITPREESYLKTGVLSIWRARIPWLLLLMISATFSSAILSRFELALPAVLLLFVPMLMDTGGNCGSQASVTVIRALSVGEATLSDFYRILRKEVAVGAVAGLSLGGVAFLKVYLIDGLLLGNGEVGLRVTLAVSLATALTVVAAKIIGASLPLFAKKIKLDPAVMASPFITTLVDAISLILYFFIALAILP